jgi:hypothetical protein
VRVTVPDAPAASVPVEDNVASASTADTVPDNPLANVPDEERVALANVLDTEPVGAGAENKDSFLLARSYAMPRRLASSRISLLDKTLL